MKLKKQLLNVFYTFTLMVATVAVNSTCHYHFYQEKLSPQLDSIKKYHEE